MLNNKNVKVADTYHHYDGHDPFDRRQTYRNKGMSPDARTKAAVRKLKLKLRNESKVNVESMCKAFLKADTQSIGKLTYSRFKEYLSEQCPELTEREINVFIKQVDPRGMGTISCESMTPFLISINEDENLESTERIRRRRSPSPHRRRRRRRPDSSTKQRTKHHLLLLRISPNQHTHPYMSNTVQVVFRMHTTGLHSEESLLLTRRREET